MGDARYSVKQLARLAGVSVRTLHVYDKLGLLTPSVRTDAGYRYYADGRPDPRFAAFMRTAMAHFAETRLE